MLDELNSLMFSIHKNINRAGFALPDTVDELLGIILRDQQRINELELQLEHSLLTGGEYLTIGQYQLN